MSTPKGNSAVQDVFENLARLEGEHAAGADGDLLARLRIAANARVLVAHDEVAEAGNLDFLAALQRFLDGIEHRLDDLGGLLLRKSADLLVDVLDDVRLGHGFLSVEKLRPPYTSHVHDVKRLYERKRAPALRPEPFESLSAQPRTSS